MKVFIVMHASSKTPVAVCASQEAAAKEVGRRTLNILNDESAPSYEGAFYIEGDSHHPGEALGFEVMS